MRSTHSGVTRVDAPLAFTGFLPCKAVSDVAPVASKYTRSLSLPCFGVDGLRRYAYGKDLSEPGQLKVHLGQVPVDGDYWVVGLGPETFGPDGAYEWALVSGP